MCFPPFQHQPHYLYICDENRSPSLSTFYFFFQFTFFIAIDTATPQHAVARIGPRLEAKPKRLRCGSGVMGLDGYMYCAPLRAKRVLRLDALSLTDAMGTTEANMLDKTKVFGWTTTALEMFVRYQCFKRGTSELPWFIDAMSERAAIVAVAAIAHWKTWAAKKARLSRGRSVNDPIVRFKDRRMKALLLKKPDVWSFGLTTVDSIRCGDLIDWLQKLHSTEVCQVRGTVFTHTLLTLS